MKDNNAAHPPINAAARKKYPVLMLPVPSCRTFIPKTEVAKFNGMNTKATSVSLDYYQFPHSEKSCFDCSSEQGIFSYLSTESDCCIPFLVSSMEALRWIYCILSLMYSPWDLDRSSIMLYSWSSIFASGAWPFDHCSEASAALRLRTVASIMTRTLQYDSQGSGCRCPPTDRLLSTVDFSEPFSQIASSSISIAVARSLVSASKTMATKSIGGILRFDMASSLRRHDEFVNNGTISSSMNL